MGKVKIDFIGCFVLLSFSETESLVFSLQYEITLVHFDLVRTVHGQATVADSIAWSKAVPCYHLNDWLISLTDQLFYSRISRFFREQAVFSTEVCRQPHFTRQRMIVRHFMQLVTLIRATLRILLHKPTPRSVLLRSSNIRIPQRERSHWSSNMKFSTRGLLFLLTASLMLLHVASGICSEVGQACRNSRQCCNEATICRGGRCRSL